MTTTAVRARDHVGRAGQGRRETFEVPITLLPGGPGRLVGSILIGVVGTTIMLLRLFFPVPVGMANNGEGTAFSCQLGMQPVLPNGVGAAWSYAILDWVIDLGTMDSACVVYPNAEVAILRAAQFFSHIFGAPDTVNLRFVMIGYCLVAGLLVGLTAHAIRRGLATRIVVSGGLFIVLADGAFVGYAGSTQGELPGIVGVAVVAVGAIYTGLSGGRRLVGLGLILIGSLGILLSVPSALVALIPIMVFLVAQAFRREVPSLRSRRTGGIRVVKGGLGRAVALSVGALVLLTGLWSVSSGPTNHRTINPYHVLAFGILGNSPDPEADLEWMGLPAQLERFTNTSVWVEDSIVDDPLWEEVRNDITYASVANFFVAHPDRAWIVANDAANQLYLARPAYLGNFTADSGEPAQQLEGRLTLASGLLGTVSGLGMIPLLLFWVLASLGGVLAIRTAPRGSIRRAFGAGALLMVGLSSVFFIASAFGDGLETTKHMVLAILALLLAAALLLGALLGYSKNSADDEVFTPRLTLT